MIATESAVDRPRSTDQVRVAALIAAGVAFSVYPLLRGSGSEVGLIGAALYARPAWLVAHCLGMAGFVLAAFGLRRFDRWAYRLALVGAIGVLPYYGAEAFGLHALGSVALTTQDPGMIAAADAFRYQPVAMITFGGGLLLLSAAGVRLSILLRRPAGILHRLGLAFAGVGLLGYLPQFFAPIEVRIGHGFLLAAGLLLLAISPVANADSTAVPASQRVAGERSDEVVHLDTPRERA